MPKDSLRLHQEYARTGSVPGVGKLGTVEGFKRVNDGGRKQKPPTGDGGAIGARGEDGDGVLQHDHKHNPQSEPRGGRVNLNKEHKRGIPKSRGYHPEPDHGPFKSP